MEGHLTGRFRRVSDGNYAIANRQELPHSRRPLFGSQIGEVGCKPVVRSPVTRWPRCATIGPALFANELSVYHFARGVNFYCELNPLAEPRRRSAFSRTRPSSYPRLSRGCFTERSHTRGHRAGAVRGSLSTGKCPRARRDPIMRGVEKGVRLGGFSRAVAWLLAAMQGNRVQACTVKVKAHSVPHI